MTIGECIKVARETLDLTLKDVSRETGIPAPTIHNIETGKANPGSVNRRVLEQWLLSKGRKVSA